MPLGIAKNAAYPAFSLLPFFAFLLPSLRWTRVTDSDGGVAQLGEHLLCKQGVIGSIPFTSTKSPWIWCKISPYRDFVFLTFLVFACLSERAFWAAPTRQAIVAEKSSIRCRLLCHSQRRAGRLASLMLHLLGHCSLNCKSGSGASLGASSRFLRWRNLSAYRESDGLMPRCLTGKRIFRDLAAKWPPATTFRGV